MKEIYFIRHGRISKEEKDCFITNIKKINSNCNFYLISINNEQKRNIIYKDQYYLEINLKYKNKKNDWTTSFLGWRKIFYYIEKNT